MKIHTLVIVFVALVVPGFTFAAKAGKKNKKAAQAATTSLAEPLKAYDANGNGRIDPDEVAAVKKAFGENPKGPLVALDKNTNGQIEDTEITPASASATASGGKGERPGRALKQADKNHNGKIDAEEIAALQKSFEADPSGPLAKIDRNGNKKLDDNEIAKINERMGKGGKKGAVPAGTTPSATAPSTDASKSSDITVKPAEKPDAAK